MPVSPTQTLIPKVVFFEEIITEEICAEITPLLQKHWEEVSHPAFKDIQELKPRFDQYIALGAQRKAVLFTARETKKVPTADALMQEPVKNWHSAEDNGYVYVGGRLVGYWVFLFSDTLHYATTKQAYGDVLFMEKEYRGKTAFDFAKECISQLKQGGIQIVHAYCKKAHDLTRFFVEGMGFEQIDLHFTKRLDQ